NLNGVGTASSPSAAVTPSGVAKAPTGITATPGASSVTVSWTAPDTGGSPITGYRVTPTTGGVAGTPQPFLSTATSGTLNGLINGQTYTFVVVAVNANGLGSPSVASQPVVPSTVPNAPSVLNLTRGNQSALVTWSVPNSGGLPITGYTVTSSPGGLTCSTSSATSCVVLGLSNGTSYTFSVIAVNANGSGAASASSASVTPLQVPSQPVGLSATHLDGSVQVSWSPPLDDGGTPIVLTTVTALQGDTPVGSCFSADTPSCTVEGLTNGATYRFIAVSSNGTGDGLPSAAVSATPSRVPDSPFSIATVSGNSTVTVSWVAPSSSGGSAPTGYLVTASPGGATCSTTVATFCTVTGLTNGVAYSFSVVAKNANGSSSASAASDLTTPADVPGVPQSVGLDSTANSTVVTWSASLNDGGSAILDYTAIASLNGADIASCNSPTGFTCTIEGLTNGVTYLVRVKATNAVGDSVATVSSPVMPSSTPGPAFGLAATKADGRATLRWFGAADTGGLPITGYRVTATPGGATCQTSGALTCTVTGLTNGQSYTFVVVALNANGSGASSAPSAAVTPSTVPGAPTAVSASLGSNRITVTWSAPLGNGGAAISGYLLTASPGGRTCQTTTALSCAMTGLTNGVTYTFNVVALNRNGSSSPSASSAPLVASPPPGAPLNPTAFRANGSAIVSWSAPLPNGGLAVTGYLVTAVPGGAVCTTTGALSCTVPGLSNGSSYAFIVVASNPAGSGPESAPTALVTPSSVPGAPIRPSATRGNTSATVTWNPPVEVGGSPITGYLVTPWVSGVQQTPRQFGSSITSVTIGGLPNGQPVTFTVAAINLNGAGPSSETSVAVV
ncbi:MAG: fibronectin type III domain-containing protein, partial [Actinomycetota bacterium]